MGGTMYHCKLLRGGTMSRKGVKTINVDEEDHGIIKTIADRNDMDIKEAVIYAFKIAFPGDFPEKVIV